MGELTYRAQLLEQRILAQQLLNDVFVAVSVGDAVEDELTRLYSLNRELMEFLYEEPDEQLDLFSGGETTKQQGADSV